jgi:NAD(P)-dependent dehydrogenase (short-subunit alcohol dehydrogenase family)
MSPAPIEADLSGKLCVVTGANSGIGKQIAENLAALGGHVVMACRNEGRGREALSDIASRVGAERLELMSLDQSLQSSIREFVAAFRAKHERLDVLVNNAGIYPAERVVGPEGIETTWATNTMGYFVLTNALVETLEASAPSRVVFVASAAAGGLALDDLQWTRRKFGGIKAYKQSKQANRMLSWVLAEKLQDRGVTVNTVHPGGVSTGISRHQKGLWGALVKLAFWTQKSVADGADTATWVAASPELDGITGKFWADRRERSCEFRQMDACRALWKQCEELVLTSP